MSEAYTPAEMMIAVAARRLKGTRTVFVGVGLPNIACNLARYTVAPELQLIYESGVYGAQPARLPLSIGDPTLVTGALSAVSMADLFGLYLQRGLVEVALLGGAQIDRYGALNTTVIGEYARPRTRLPGSGGACEIAINAQKVYLIMRLKRRAFVGQLDFVTSPGHRTQENQPGGQPVQPPARRGGGPALVITDKALFDFDGPDRTMRLVELYPGVRPEAVHAEVGWPLAVAPSVRTTPSPTEAELHLMRTQLDPHGLYRS
jgi:glutaconate CoA-transferase subunit B